MPPFLATLAGKIIGALVALVLVFALGLYEGCALKQQAWDAAIAKQAMKAADVVVKQGENTAKVVTKYIKIRGENEAQAEARSVALQKELDAYVQDHPAKCPVPESVVRVFDAPADRVPTAPSAPSGAVEAAPAITTVELVQALDAYRTEYGAVAGQLTALIEWVETSHEIQKEGAGR